MGSRVPFEVTLLSQRTVIILSLSALLLLLTMQAAIDSLFFNDKVFWTNMFQPEPRQFFQRFTFTVFALAMILLGRRRLHRQEQTRAQQKASDDRYRTLVETSPACIVAHDENGIVFANQPTLDLFGVPDFEPFRGSAVLDFVHPDFKESIIERMKIVRETGQTTPMKDIQILLLDGSTKSISITTTSIEFDGKPTLVTFFQDLTDLKETHRDLLDSQERLQLALDAAQDGIWDWDVTTDEIIYNEAWARMLGYELDDLEPSLRTWEEMIHPADRDRAKITLQDHLDGKTPNYVSELRLRHGAGHYIWILDKGRIVAWDRLGNPTRVAGTHRDINIRKEAELALEIRNRVARIFLTGHDVDIYSDITKMVCEATNSMAGLFGIVDPGPQVRIKTTCLVRDGVPDIQQPASMVFNPEKLPPFFQEVLDRREPVIQNHELALTDPHAKIENAMAVPIVIGDLVVGLLVVANRVRGYNMSDAALVESLAEYLAPILQSYLSSQAKEAQLRQAQKMEALGALAGGIAHDFNNILQAILGFTTLAKEQADKGGPLESDLSRVLKAAGRGKDLVKSILLFSRREEHERHSVAIEPIIREAVDLLTPTIPSTIEVRSRLEAGDAQIMADPSQISQIVLNLATNAYHAMEEIGGILEVDLDLIPRNSLEPDIPAKLRGMELISLSISDTGSGMTPDIMDRLFDPFFTTKEVGKGTGLGLSVVHGIVVGHLGEILISSEPGCGTVVRIFLPRATKSEAHIETEFDRGTGLSTGRILFVDDEKDIADFGEAVLIREGHTVTAIGDSREALALFRKDPDAFDLLITDLTMPHLPGLQLATEVTSIRPELPVILITGVTDKPDWELGPQQVISSVVRKPFDQETLCRKVKIVLGLTKQVGESG
jgi:PAS domain S-box-containing protein